MRKKIVHIIIGIVLLGIGISLIKEYRIKEAMQLTQEDILEDHFYDQYEWISDRFVRNSFTNEEQGVQDEESIFVSLNLLYMEYLLNDNNRIGFEKVVRFMQENLLTEEGLVGFGAHKDLDLGTMEVIEKTSLADNLKFYKLLTKAYLAWGEPYYSDLAEKIAEKIQLYNIKNGKFNLRHEGEAEHGEIELYELDLKGLALLAEDQMLQKDIYKQSKKILKNAYIHNELPLYYSSYDYINKVYIETERIDTLESLLIVKELAENNGLKKGTVKWLKNQLKSGGIYEQYNTHTGIVTSHEERISIYAVVAQIGKVEGDIELYTLAMEKMLKFQVKDSKSEFYGSFINKETGKADCYENLQALLAF